MSQGGTSEENGVRPPPREELDGPPFPVEPRRDWHEMVVEEERERAAAEEMRQRAADAVLRRAERRRLVEEASVLLHAAATRERERERERKPKKCASGRRTRRCAVPTGWLPAHRSAR